MKIFFENRATVNADFRISFLWFDTTLLQVLNITEVVSPEEKKITTFFDIHF